MSDLDNVSYSLGQLKQAVEDLTKTQDRMIAFMKESDDRFNDRFTVHEEADRKNFEALNEKFAGLDKFRIRVYAIASVCAFVCTSAINFATNWFGGKAH